MKKLHLIGAIVASFAFALVIFAGALGQLFSLSGRTGSMPAYGTTAVPNGWDIGYADVQTFDEKGKLIEFSKALGVLSSSDNSPGDVCPDQKYVLSLKDQKVWKKGSMLSAVELSVKRKIEPLLKACEPPVGTEFQCASGCTEERESEVIEAEPLTISLLKADAVAQGLLQYVLTLNGGCIRIKHCVAS